MFHLNCKTRILLFLLLFFAIISIFVLITKSSKGNRFHQRLVSSVRNRISQESLQSLHQRNVTSTSLETKEEASKLEPDYRNILLKSDTIEENITREVIENRRETVEALAGLVYKTHENENPNVLPYFNGSSQICRSKSKQLDCPPRSLYDIECLKVTFVGLCGGWTKTLRKLPAMFSCPGLENAKVLLDHADKPENIEHSDIVVFNFLNAYMNMDVWIDLRSYKSPGQMWVFQTEESPFYAVGHFPPWMYRKDTYDISNTYRSDADIHSPYGYFVPYRSEESNQAKDTDVLLTQKSRLVVWISSHCETLHWDRTKFVKDLQKYMDVDIFGRCGNRSLCSQRISEQCAKEVDALLSTYKFNLALENCCCEDYLTEKLWHTYSVGSVPVVVGPRKSNYEKFAPPGSFIHADDFDSIASLNMYLEYLDKNDTAYLEYFQWRNVGTVREHSIREHFTSHFSDNTICKIVNKYSKRKELRERRLSTIDELKMFDPYGPEWKGTCHSCGKHQWIKDYEYSLDHQRNNKWIWAR